LTPGTRRNGSSKFGPFNRAIRDPWAQSGLGARGGRDHEYTGRHVSPRRETARKRVGKAVPVAAVAATLAAGAAAYSLAGAGQPAAAQLNAATVRPSTASSSVVGKTNAAADAMIRATTAPAFASHAATAAAPTAKAKPAASRTSTRSPAAPPAHASAATTRAAVITRAAAITRAASHPAATTLSCDLNYSLLPQNVTAIVSFLLAHGYSDNAAAGIAGNIYQESKGDPESVGMGGGGLIGWTPLPYGFVTGDVSADLQTQLAALLTYNQIWSSYLPALNSAASPAEAAYIDVTDFERAGIPAASTREASAENVASACGI
jgi:Phage tail lysozyme